MRWRKLGLVYAPDGRQEWALSHAAVPTPLMLSKDVVRIYISHADASTVSRVGYIDVSTADPLRVIAAAAQPLLDIGQPGTFDDNGVNACCVLPADGGLRMYYVGYQLQRKIPYTLFSGLAVSADADGPFRRVQRVPILDRTDGELYLRTAPFVLREGDRWRMWYVGGSEWTMAGGKAYPIYSMRHIQSDDGVTWSGSSFECFAPNRPDEIGFGRPFVVREGNLYRMWYSVRAVRGYRIGYATSDDGLHWTRRDGEVGIDCSETGWDSEMICFSALVRTENRWLMFYNGNGYGRTGVGVAVSDDD